MVFSSLEFLFLYLPIALGVYYLLPIKFRNIWLLAISLVFYGWGEPIYLLLMVFTIIVDYIGGYLVDKYKDNRKKAKRVLILSVIINLAILGFFKYYDFIVGSILNLIPGVNIPLLGLGLPIGISFYTFQALSYVIDVYRGDAPAQKKITSFGAYVTLFPQLIAGPIVRYKDVDDQLNERHESVELFASGIRTFIAGLGKKIIFANTVGQLWEYFRDIPGDERTVVAAWLGIICYSFQLYFDFSAYSDMAIGLGKMIGFRFLENFNYPYISQSITDFWRRWHMSLSTWFRDNVYFPLGGSRCSKLKMYRNLFIVWMLTGIWHGAYWNYILWGVYYGIILIIEKAFLLKWLEKIPRFFRHVYSLLIVLFGWLLFVFEDTVAGIAYLKNMFGIGTSAGFISQTDIYDILRNGVFLIILAIACTPLPKKIFYKLYFSKGKKATVTHCVTAVACACILVLSTAYLVDSSFNPFLYFRF